MNTNCALVQYLIRKCLYTTAVCTELALANNTQVSANAHSSALTKDVGAKCFLL